MLGISENEKSNSAELDVCEQSEEEEEMDLWSVCIGFTDLKCSGASAHAF